ncbi:Transcriptional Coactivator p15 (PC4), partial [Gilliamella apicola SCGC AB-598-B02]
MISQSFSLPFIPAKNKHSLLLALRDYYENIGQYLPNKKLARTPIAQLDYEKKMPQSISYNEIKLWQVDQEDHPFRAQFFSDLPDFLAGYFADKYINIFQIEGRKKA